LRNQERPPLAVVEPAEQMDAWRVGEAAGRPFPLPVLDRFIQGVVENGYALNVFWSNIGSPC